LQPLVISREGTLREIRSLRVKDSQNFRTSFVAIQPGARQLTRMGWRLQVQFQMVGNPKLASFR
jgi:hypothetical protein